MSPGTAPAPAALPRRRGILDPLDRFSEALFGLIMVLTFTSSLSAAQGGRQEMREILVGALCCNVAWGIVDAAMYVVTRSSESLREERDLARIRSAADPASGVALLAASLPPAVRRVLGPGEIEDLRKRVAALPPGEPVRHFGADVWIGALAVFLWVFVTALPLIAPFVVMKEPLTALRVSNGIALLLLFATGWCLARAHGQRPVRTGLAMVAIGLLLVGITIALGG